VERPSLLQDRRSEGTGNRDEGVIHLLGDSRLSRNGSERNDRKCQRVLSEALAVVVADEERLCVQMEFVKEVFHFGISPLSGVAGRVSAAACCYY
jgi:hypothetical protein